MPNNDNQIFNKPEMKSWGWKWALKEIAFWMCVFTAMRILGLSIASSGVCQ